MSQDWEQLALSGTHLSKGEAEALEELVKKDPKDIPSRLKLVGFLRPHAIRQDKERQKWVEHVLWFIEHHPTNAFVGSPFCSIGRENPAYDRAVELWNRLVESESAPPEVLLNAARFFALWDPPRTRTLLERGEQVAPSRPVWAKHLGHDLLRSVKVAQAGEDRGRKPRHTPEERKQLAAQALAHFERALGLAPSAQRRFSLLEPCAEAAFEAERSEEAVRYADEILVLAPQCPEERHRPDYVHTAHIIRGMAALKNGDVKASCMELDAAGRQGSSHAPVLRSFGPNFRLAQNLLERGETKVVLSYLDQCATFWKEKRVAKWRSEIERGGRPLMFTGYDPNDKS